MSCFTSYFGSYIVLCKESLRHLSQLLHRISVIMLTSAPNVGNRMTCRWKCCECHTHQKKSELCKGGNDVFTKKNQKTKNTALKSGEVLIGSYLDSISSPQAPFLTPKSGFSLVGSHLHRGQHQSLWENGCVCRLASQYLRGTSHRASGCTSATSPLTTHIHGFIHSVSHCISFL